MILTDGVIFNSAKFCAENGSLPAYISAGMDRGERFWKDFRGSFSGAVYNKEAKKWIFYVNHCGDRPIFYYKNGDSIIVSSSLYAMTNTLRKNGVELTICKGAAYNIMTYAHMQDSETLFNEIKKIRAGECLSLDAQGNFEIIRWHKFDNTQNINWSEDEIIEKIDRLFRNAVNLQFKKDDEYGYEHLASLSSGLDARMCVWVARNLGYEVTTCTFSQTGFLDEQIAEQMASYLRCNYLFASLDSGVFMKQFDKVSKMSYGMVTTSNIVHAMSMMEKVNLRRYGMLHTGQIGDVVISSFCNNTVQEPSKPFYITYSRYLAGKNHDKSYSTYDNMEQWLIYTRAFQGAMCSQIAHYNYQEMFSPFCDVEFLEYCMSIPLRLRTGHYIYKKWIMQKYPDAAKFKWGAINGSLADSEKKQKLNGLKKRVIGRIRRILKQKNDPKYAMTPYDYWYSRYPDINDYIERYYETNIGNIHLPDDLRVDMKNLFENGTSREKMMVLTILSIVKNYFDYEN